MKSEQDYNINNNEGKDNFYGIQSSYNFHDYEVSQTKRKSYVNGVLTGIVVSTVFAFLVFSIIKFYDNVGIVEKAATESAESVTDETITKKIGLLEKTIDKYFWKDTEKTKLENGIYKGLVDSLEDPYSVYYTHEELLELQQQTQGIYYGIGAYISQDKETGYVQISKIIKGTPAEESALMPKDYIYEVNGESMQGKDSAYVVSKIKGEEGSFVTITVVREGVNEPIDIEVQRRKIESPTVEYVMHDNGIAYIQITEFDLVTTGQFESAYNQAKSDNMKGLIIDLRSNPGGNLSTVCDISRMILPKGLIVYTEDKYGERNEYTCNGKNQINVPLIVLTDGYSASASEILAGAVKDYGIGKIMGTTTYGKGIVQKVIDMSDGSAIKLTVSTYYTPNGNNIHEIGVEPDIVVEFDYEQYLNGVDNQLEAAKEEMLKMIRER